MKKGGQPFLLGIVSRLTGFLGFPSHPYQPASLAGISREGFILGVGFPLRLLSSGLFSSERSYPSWCSLAEHLVPSGSFPRSSRTRGHFSFNLSYAPADRAEPVSGRSEPSSRTALNGEQPYPWDLLQPQDCDEPTSRCQTSPSM